MIPIRSLDDVGSARCGLIGEEVDWYFAFAVRLGDGDALVGDGRLGGGLTNGSPVLPFVVPCRIALSPCTPRTPFDLSSRPCVRVLSAI
jgi:hypothetical protein